MRRLPLIVGAGLAVAAAVGVALQARYLRRRRERWRVVLAERIPVHSKFWRDHAAAIGDENDSPLLYVAIGDSAAQGIGASRPDHSYVGVLARSLRTHTDRAVRVVNLGVSGATVALAVRDQLPKFAKLEPDIVTVSIGGNDIASFDPTRFERELATLLDALPPHAIVADLPSFHFLPAERKVRVANAIVRRLAAERGLTVAPLHARTRRQGIWGVSTQFAGDLFHSNDRGYRVWASAFEPAVLARLAQFTARGNE
jgi:lysophospholipase L1-like esterase